MPRKKKNETEKKGYPRECPSCTRYDTDERCANCSEEERNRLLANLEVPEQLSIAEPIVVVEVSRKAQLLALLDTMPTLPATTDPNFLRKLVADYIPQIWNWQQRLREFAECLP